jgi:uncharacterized protein
MNHVFVVGSIASFGGQKMKASAEATSGTLGSRFGEHVLPIKDLEGRKLPQFIEQNGVVLLKGSVSRSSGYKMFPECVVCPVTGARDMEQKLFGPCGTLYSYSSVHISASMPTPYTIGYVDFPEGVRVLAHIESNEALNGTLACDTIVELRADHGRWFVVPVSADEPSKKTVVNI